LCNLGVKVVFGDIQAEAGEKQAQKLSTFPVKFLKTDVTKYEDLLALFDTALKTFGRADCAIANAGVVEVGNWVGPNLGLEGIKKVYPTHLLYKRTTKENSKKIPSQRTLDVNLLGTLYFT